MSLWPAWLALALSCAGGLVAGCGADGARLEGHATPFVQALRPDNPSSTGMFRFDAGETVETYRSVAGAFTIHFSRSGANAVPDADADSSGVPDFVEQAATTYDNVLAFYTGTLGFDPPLSDQTIIADNGGDGTFDVYMIDFGGVGADGAFRIDACLYTSPDRCVGYMVQENDFAEYGYPSTAVGNAILGSHEFFHAVQAAYDIEQGAVLSEGTATWATEAYDAGLNDFEVAVSGYLTDPGTSLERPPSSGPVARFSYGSAIFFRFLDERYDTALIRILWESCRNGAGGIDDPRWLAQLPGILGSEAATTFPQAFVEFAIWNLYTGSRADPARSYANGADYVSVTQEPIEVPFVDDRLRLFSVSSQYYVANTTGRTQMTAAIVAVDPVDLEGVKLVVAAERSSSWDEVLVADELAAAPVLDTSNATRFLAMAVNTNISGTSRRPALCIGTPDEVAACRVSIVGVPKVDPPAEDDGCLAAVPASPAVGALGLAILALRRRKS